jgi:hypothetical protein
MKKIISISLIVVLIVNLLLLAFRMINPLLFWVIIAVIGFFAFKILPKFN